MCGVSAQSVFRFRASHSKEALVDIKMKLLPHKVKQYSKKSPKI